MASDLTLFIDTTRRVFVQSQTSAQPLTSLELVQGEDLNVVLQFLALTGNGLAPYANVDPTSWSAALGVGYVDSAGVKHLLALTTAWTAAAISGAGSVQTGLAGVLNLATSAISGYVGNVNSAPLSIEQAWDFSPSASTAYSNRAQVPGVIETGYVGVGLPTPT